MIPLALPLLAVGKSWWKAALGAVVIFPMAFLLGECTGQRSERARAAGAAAIKAAPLNAKAADERLTDTVNVQTRTEEARNAVAQVPDGRPSAGSVALNCERVRLAGGPIPAACVRPKGGGQAPAN
jgi:hypothetical protein